MTSFKLFTRNMNFSSTFNLVQLKVSSEIEISNANTEKRPNWLIFLNEHIIQLFKWLFGAF